MLLGNGKISALKDMTTDELNDYFGSKLANENSRKDKGNYVWKKPRCIYKAIFNAVLVFVVEGILISFGTYSSNDTLDMDSKLLYLC